MMATKNILKYILISIGGLFVLYNSIYFKPLDEVKKEALARVFDPKTYANDFWEYKLIPNLDQAIELDTLIKLLKTNPSFAFENYSNALGIGNIRFFLVSGIGKVKNVYEDHVVLDLNQENTVRLATDYIFGNAIRDASGQININEFTNTMDFNNVSAEINHIVVNNVLPEFIIKVRVGDTVKFHGALELNQVHLQLDQIEIIPIYLSIQNPESR